MKFFYLSVFFLLRTSFAFSGKFTAIMSDNQKITCSQERSIHGYFCNNDKDFLIISSMGDFYSSYGQLGGDENIKGYSVREIKDHRGNILFSNSTGIPGFGNTNVKSKNIQHNFSQNKTLSQEISDTDVAITLLNQSGLLQSGNIKPSKKFHKFITRKLLELNKKKELLSKKVQSNYLIVMTKNGKNLNCERLSEKQKSKFDLNFEKMYHEVIRCGVFSCGKDKNGNDIYLYSHYSPSLGFSDLLTFDKDGFINGPKVSKVNILDEEIPLYQFDDRNRGPFYIGGSKREVTERDYVPDNLKEQSQFFQSINSPGYKMSLVDTSHLCSDDFLDKYNKTLAAYKDKLGKAQLIQYVTVINNSLTSFYINPDNLPGGFCEKNGIYYNPKYLSKVQNVQPSFFERSISIEKANELYTEAKEMKKIAWNYIQDGCYARAHIVAKKIEEAGIYVDKAWLKGNLSYQAKSGYITRWNFHVAPMVYVRAKDGNILKYVIDPSTFDKPVPVETWAKKLNINNSSPVKTVFPFPLNSAMYGRTSLSFSNISPYLPDDPLKRSNEEKMKMAEDTMRRYLGVRP